LSKNSELESETTEFNAYLYGLLTENIIEGRQPLDFTHLSDEYKNTPIDLSTIRGYVPYRVIWSTEDYYKGSGFTPRYRR